MIVSSRTNPELSIVIPLYNKELYIQRAVNSVLSQTFKNFEVIVVNDGSTDNSLAFVSSIADHRVKIINQDNAGVSVARNKGTEFANSDYIAFLDADDELKPEYLARMFALIKEFPQARTFASAYEVIRPTRRSIKRHFPADKGLINFEEFLEKLMMGYRPLGASSIIAEKKLLHEIGFFPVGQTRGEDTDTWFRLLRKAPCAFINEPLVIIWSGLPHSACVSNKDIVSSTLVEELESNIAHGKYQKEMHIKIIDFLAWRQFGNIDRLIKSGKGGLARERIRLAMRSKRFRIKLYKMYLQSLLKNKF